jgi:elongation factor Ts
MIELVKEVRERSGAPMGECKKALDDASGNIEKALELLQARGAAKAVAKGGRIASEGLVHTYLHGGRIGVLLEVNCETDFVARNPEFIRFCEDTAMHIAAMNPLFVRKDEIPTETLAARTTLYAQNLKESGKPEAAWPKILDGKIAKWVEENCLVDQESVVHPKQKIEALRVALVAKMGENIQVRRFVRFEMGEGTGKGS